MFKLYSERNADPSSLPDIYEYNNIPDKFRAQLFYILEDIFNYRSLSLEDCWNNICYCFARENGDKTLTHNLQYGEIGQRIIEAFISSRETLELLDFIDFVFYYISELKNDWEFKHDEVLIYKIDQGITELNYRFKQNNLGYEFVNNELIRIDNKLLHQEVIKPALHLLHLEEFKGAEEEFLKAFEYRRNNDNKNAILEALKSFESTMKTICDKKGYDYDSNKDTAKKLISILELNNFYPSYMNNNIANVRATLETGLPVIRNKEAGHGQGSSVVNVSDEFTEYALNLAATNIVLLVKIYQTQK